MVTTERLLKQLLDDLALLASLGMDGCPTAQGIEQCLVDAGMERDDLEAAVTRRLNELEATAECDRDCG